MQNDESLASLISRNSSAEELIQKIAHLSLMLKGNMQELGLDKEIEKAAESIPDATERLRYIASMTEQAANRVLNCVDRATPLAEKIKVAALKLDEMLGGLDRHAHEPHVVREISLKMRTEVASITSDAFLINKELLEILMAQDFQDLTGQVIKKMMTVISEIGHQLITLLSDSNADGYTESVVQRLAESEWEGDDDKKKELPGPQIKPTPGEAVGNQGEVDDLLGSLGF
ncbi:protein phosphatase CheZ [Pseudomonas aeruginosa]